VLPQIVALLQDNNTFTRALSAKALSKLSEQCKISAINL
jgi:hypothetical protein